MRGIGSKIGEETSGEHPTSSLYADEMNSPQSQKLAVGSSVRIYVTAAITKTIQPQMLFNNRYCFMINMMVEYLNYDKDRRKYRKSKPFIFLKDGNNHRISLFIGRKI